MKVHDKAPGFSLLDQDGNKVSLKDFAGKTVVMFFYPKADTPGCTIEACGFRDTYKKIQATGTVFLGPWSAQPFGDYASGSNHVLPTAGWARARGGLSTADFVKCISVQHINEMGFARLAQDVQILARAEGLLAHANAVGVRR